MVSEQKNVCAPLHGSGTSKTRQQATDKRKYKISIIFRLTQNQALTLTTGGQTNSLVP